MLIIFQVLIHNFCCIARKMDQENMGDKVSARSCDRLFLPFHAGPSLVGGIWKIDSESVLSVAAHRVSTWDSS